VELGQEHVGRSVKQVDRATDLSASDQDARTGLVLLDDRRVDRQTQICNAALRLNAHFVCKVVGQNLRGSMLFVVWVERNGEHEGVVTTDNLKLVHNRGLQDCMLPRQQVSELDRQNLIFFSGSFSQNCSFPRRHCVFVLLFRRFLAGHFRYDDFIVDGRLKLAKHSCLFERVLVGALEGVARWRDSRR